MIRCRRRVREIPFSFDSFLDVVANVCGIIIRLILVVWVGARSYNDFMAVPRPAAPALAEEKGKELTDPLQDEVTRQRQELALAQSRLLEQLRHLQQVKVDKTETARELTTATQRAQSLEQEKSKIEQVMASSQQLAGGTEVTLADLRERGKKLTADIEALQKLPPLKKVLRYKTPVSRPVHGEELLFECRGGRVTFVDIAALLAEVRQGIQDKAQLLRSQWQVDGVAGPVGPFRLRYVVERERGMLDNLAAAGTPAETGNFSYGLSEWVVEPIAADRGETAATALTKGSEFRQVVDYVDPRQTVITFWVYPDSFAVYRQLRDYLHGHDVEVAGRPLPEGTLISSSRRGTVSRGQ
jgi:hypothetical protein